MLGVDKIHETPRLAAELSQLLPEIGIAYASPRLGPARYSQQLPDTPQRHCGIKKYLLLRRDGRRSNGASSPAAVRACAEVIVSARAA